MRLNHDSELLPFRDLGSLARIQNLKKLLQTSVFFNTVAVEDLQLY